MRSVILLKQTIQQMASGDLKSYVPKFYQDEIGILAHELDGLRTALSETLIREQESQKANQDLISALSHDLRTPLTILNGYLEVAKLNKIPEMQTEYLNRCLSKSDEIREITDRIFEYAYVYEETETPTLTPLPVRLLSQHLEENAGFLRLMGFTVNTDLQKGAFSPFLPSDSGCCLPNRIGQSDPLYFAGDKTLIKRIFNNLFSNIIKYGSKKEPINIIGSADCRKISVVLENTVKPDFSGIESTRIGLKSVRKMLALMDGTLETTGSLETFTAILELPLTAGEQQSLGSPTSNTDSFASISS